MAADNTTGLHVKSKSDESVRSKLVDAAGTNEAAIDSSGRLSVDGSGAIQPIVEEGAAGNSAAQVAVSDTSTTVAIARAGRRGVLLLNRQTVPVYLNPAGTAATTGHFILVPEAGVFLPVVSAVTAITSAPYTPSGDDKVHVVDVF